MAEIKFNLNAPIAEVDTLSTTAQVNPMDLLSGGPLQTQGPQTKLPVERLSFDAEESGSNLVRNFTDKAGNLVGGIGNIAEMIAMGIDPSKAENIQRVNQSIQQSQAEMKDFWSGAQYDTGNVLFNELQGFERFDTPNPGNIRDRFNEDGMSLNLVEDFANMGLAQSLESADSMAMLMSPAGIPLYMTQATEGFSQDAFERSAKDMSEAEFFDKNLLMSSSAAAMETTGEFLMNKLMFGKTPKIPMPLKPLAIGAEEAVQESIQEGYGEFATQFSSGEAFDTDKIYDSAIEGAIGGAGAGPATKAKIMAIEKLVGAGKTGAKKGMEVKDQIQSRKKANESYDPKTKKVNKETLQASVNEAKLTSEQRARDVSANPELTQEQKDTELEAIKDENQFLDGIVENSGNDKGFAKKIKDWSPDRLRYALKRRRDFANSIKENLDGADYSPQQFALYGALKEEANTIEGMLDTNNESITVESTGPETDYAIEKSEYSQAKLTKEIARKEAALEGFDGPLYEQVEMEIKVLKQLQTKRVKSEPEVKKEAQAQKNTELQAEQRDVEQRAKDNNLEGFKNNAFFKFTPEKIDSEIERRQKLLKDGDGNVDRLNNELEVLNFAKKMNNRNKPETKQEEVKDERKPEEAQEKTVEKETKAEPKVEEKVVNKEQDLAGAKKHAKAVEKTKEFKEKNKYEGEVSAPTKLNTVDGVQFVKTQDGVIAIEPDTKTVLRKIDAKNIKEAISKYKQSPSITEDISTNKKIAKPQDYRRVEVKRKVSPEKQSFSLENFTLMFEGNKKAIESRERLEGEMVSFHADFNKLLNDSSENRKNPMFSLRGEDGTIDRQITDALYVSGMSNLLTANAQSGGMTFKQFTKDTGSNDYNLYQQLLTAGANQSRYGMSIARDGLKAANIKLVYNGDERFDIADRTNAYIGAAVIEVLKPTYGLEQHKIKIGDTDQNFLRVPRDKNLEAILEDAERVDYTTDVDNKPVIDMGDSRGIDSVRRREGYVPTAEKNLGVEESQKIDMTINMSMGRILEHFGDKDVLDIMGFESTEDRQGNILESVKARNMSLQKTLRTSKMFMEDVGTRNFNFNYFMTAGGRFSIDANVFNPQADSELSRWMINYNTGMSIRTPAQKIAFKRAIVQSFDNKIENMSDGHVENTYNKIVDELGSLNYDNVMAGDKAAIRQLYKIAKDNEGLHTVRNTIELLRYLDSGENSGFRTHAIMEVDGTTNGYAFLISEMAHEASVEDFQRVGMFSQGELIQTKAEFATSEMLDSYQNLANDFKEITLAKTDPYTTGIISILTEKYIGRPLAKSPFMTTSYGQSLDSVGKGLSFVVAGEILSKVDQNNQEALQYVREAIGKPNLQKNDTLTKEQYEQLAKSLEQFVEPFKGILEDKLAPLFSYQEKLNKNTIISGLIYQKAYNKFFRKDMTLKEHADLEAKLFHIKPSVANYTPLGESNIYNSQPLFETGSSDDGSESVSVGKTSVSFSQNEVQPSKGGGAVMPTHSKDATAMGMSLVSTFRANSNYGGFEVFDAFLGNPDAAAEFTTFYNRHFREINENHSMYLEADAMLKRVYRGAKKLGVEGLDTVTLKSEYNEKYNTDYNPEAEFMTNAERASFKKKQKAALAKISQYQQMSGFDPTIAPTLRAGFGEVEMENELFRRSLNSNTIESTLMEFTDNPRETSLEILGMIRKFMDKEVALTVYENPNLHTAGETSGNDVKMSLGLNSVMDAEEVLLHEMVHVLSQDILTPGNPLYDHSLATKAEEINATMKNFIEMKGGIDYMVDMGMDRYGAEKLHNILFEGDKNISHETLAYATTNETFQKILKDMPKQQWGDNKTASKQVIPLVMEILRDVIRTIGNLFGRGRTRQEKTYQDALHNVMVRSFRSQDRIRRQKNPVIRTFRKFGNGLDLLNNAASPKIKRAVQVISKPIGKMGSVAYKGANRVYKPIFHQDLEEGGTYTAMRRIFIKEDNYFTRNVSDALQFHTSVVMKESLELQDGTIKYLAQELGHPDSTRDKAFKNALVDTDLSVFIRNESLDISEITELINSPEKAQELIDKHLDQIKNITSPDQYILLKTMSESLGSYLHTKRHKADMGQTNAINVVDLVADMTTVVKDKDLLVKKVDELASMYAAKEYDGKREFTEKEVKLVTEYKNTMDMEADEKFFNDTNGKSNKIKGYTRHKFDYTVDVQYVDTEGNTPRLLEERGFKKYNDNIYYSGIPPKRYTQGLIDTMNNTTRGTRRVLSSVDDSTTELNKRKRNLWAQARGKKPMYDESYNRANIVENVNGVYMVRDMMDTKTMRELMNIDERLTYSLGHTAGSMRRKYNKNLSDKFMLKLLNDDYRQSTEEERKKDFRVIHIKPGLGSYDSVAYSQYTDPINFKYASRMPDNVLQTLYGVGQEVMYVRKTQLDEVFGFEEKTLKISEHPFAGSKNKFDAQVRLVNQKLAYFDRFHKGFISFFKETIVVKTLSTFIGNSFSNMHLLFWRVGVSPIEFFTESAKVGKLIHQYRIDQSELFQLHSKEGSGEKIDQRRANMLEDRVKNNPVHKTVGLGMFHYIAEEIAMDGTQGNNFFKSEVQNGLAYAVRKLANRNPKGEQEAKDIAGKVIAKVTLDESTSIGKALNLSAQYGDFIARHIMYTRLTQKGMPPKEARDVSNETFIDYRKNDSQLLEYGNAMGIFPFVKFALNINRVAYDTVVERPASVLSTLMLNGVAGDLSPFQDNNILSNNIGSETFHGVGSGMKYFDIVPLPLVNDL